MRIAERMDVTHGASDSSCWDIENLGELRSVQVAAGSDLDPGIATLGDQWRQPADLQLKPDDDEQIRLAKF